MDMLHLITQYFNPLYSCSYTGEILNVGIFPHTFAMVCRYCDKLEKCVDAI